MAESRQSRKTKVLFFISLYFVTCNGLVYPKDSSSKKLDGILIKEM